MTRGEIPTALPSLLVVLRRRVRSNKWSNYVRRRLCRASKGSDLALSSPRHGCFGVVGRLLIAHGPPRSDGDSDRYAPGCRWSSWHRHASSERTDHPAWVEWKHRDHYCRCQRSILSTRSRGYIHRLSAESAVRRRHWSLPELGTSRRDQRRHEQRGGQLPGEVMVAIEEHGLLTARPGGRDPEF